MRCLRPGEQLYPGISEFDQGTHFNYTISGCSLIYAISHPDSSWTNAFRNGKVTLGLALREQAIFLVSKFGPMPWRVAHYNWWINPPVMRPEAMDSIDVVTPVSNVAAILVDSDTGIVRAIRSVYPPSTLAKLLLVEVEFQIRSRFEPWDYLDLIDGVLGCQSEVDALIRNAVCMKSSDQPERNPDPFAGAIRSRALN
jgi:hypothetical protein